MSEAALAAAPVPAAVPAPSPSWTLRRRVGFRLAFCFFVLWLEPFPLGMLPYGSILTRPSDYVWDKLTLWLGRVLLHRTLDVSPNGSGDTTANWVQLGILVAGTLVGALVWSILDRRRTQYDRLARWLHVYVRFAVGTTMLGYGMAKVYHLQFPFPSPGKLEQPYGDASPMGLLWTFMGFSAPYNVFTGLAEAVPAVLLFFRRTATLGALLLAAVLTNVVMLNFCYDVPVKIFSTELLLASLYIAGPRLRALIDLLLRERAVPAPVNAPLIRRRRPALAARLAGVAFAAYTVGEAIWSHRSVSTGNAATLQQSGLIGAWEVETFTRDGVALEPLLTEKTRWKSVFVSEYKGYGRIMYRQMDDYYDRLDFSRNADGKTLDVEAPPGGNGKLAWRYTQPDKDHLSFSGTLDGHPFAATLHRRAGTRTFRLVTRGFHWVNEAPYNR